MPVSLASAGFLISLGLALFVIGNVFDYSSLAVIGGGIVVGVGAGAVTEGGIEQKVGENRTITNESSNQTTVDIRAEYERIQTPLNFPLGTLVMFAGAALVLHSLAEEA